MVVLAAIRFQMPAMTRLFLYHVSCLLLMAGYFFLVLGTAVEWSEKHISEFILDCSNFYFWDYCYGINSD